ncbi:IS1595 family transposase [Parvularcula maris]|uniref:IS1595 family transposase n=1 Tax=Parvularcula maris TaxID=2965077 RepID=A0A9X2L8S2_9PROT|nr:IS1595 family transposase [Parvularcula maris]MCQ8185166.1 IS1595 family transposase [Parvularcula maris]
MTQHHLLSAASRTLSLKAIYKGGEDKAYETFRRVRWPETNGEAVCPRCGHDEAYSITTRRKFKCKSCHHQFSVTSGTIFHARKLDFTDLLAAILLIANAAKGISAVQLSRDLDVQYKTAFVLAHKLREAMTSETRGLILKGAVEIDGQYHGGHIRPSNLKANRRDRRLRENQTGKRRVVVAMREKGGRTITKVVPAERHGVTFAIDRLQRGSELHADEANHWDELEALFPMARINHQEGYSIAGACTNQAESFFSRLRRMVQGQHHHVSPGYLHQYAAHAAWLEDHRRDDNGTQARTVLDLGLAAPVSRQWKGYWQR